MRSDPHHHFDPWITTIASLLVTLATATSFLGCRLFTGDDGPVGRSPLKPARPSPDSVTLEIFWARYPWGDSELNEAVWANIDESQLSPALRQELVANGFRAGIVGGTVPAAIAQVLKLEKNLTAEQTGSVDRAEAIADLLAEPAVRQRRLQLKAGRRAEIQASDNHAKLPLLVVQEGELCGATYTDAQAIYALEVEPQGDRTVKLLLTPELHHGPPQSGYTGGDGILRQVQTRQREVFSHLRSEVTLAAGEMLMITGSPDSASRLGHCFHAAEVTEGRQQKLVVIRLAQVPEGDAFAMRDGVWPF